MIESFMKYRSNEQPPSTLGELRLGTKGITVALTFVTVEFKRGGVRIRKKFEDEMKARRWKWRYDRRKVLEIAEETEDEA